MNRMLASNDTVGRELTSTVTAMHWVGSHPEAALDWALTHLELFDGSYLASMAMWIGQSDRQLATTTIDRLPAEHRNGWIVAAATGMASRDADIAIDWIARFRGQPVHESALRRIVTTIGGREPEKARQIAAQHVTNPELRRQLEAQLAPRPGR